MSELRIVVVRDGSGPRVVERGDGVEFDLEERALKIAAAFGPRPRGVLCPDAVLRVAGVTAEQFFHVRVADVPNGSADPPLRFTFTADAAVDPFDGTPAGPRPVGAVRETLRTGDGPLLLGTTQAVLDGCKVAVVRAAPDDAFARGVWMLLPCAHRQTVSFASFAFTGELNFDFAVYAAAPAGRFLSEDRCRDYPEGRYELAVQSAAETGDQAELDRLFARKTSSEVMRLAATVLLLALAVAAVARFL